MREGRITAEEAEEHPQRSIVTRALGAEAHVLADHFTWRAQDGDVYLICSDGLTDMVAPRRGSGEIIAARRARCATAGRALVEAANAAGGRDNITVRPLPRRGGPGRRRARRAAGEETMVGGGLTAAEVRAALAERAARPPQARAPRGPRPRTRAGTPASAARLPAARRRRRRRRRQARRKKRRAAAAPSVLRTLGFLAVFGLPLLLARVHRQPERLLRRDRTTTAS